MLIDNLPPLRSVIESYGLVAKKSLGQNFLFDLNLTAKIARQAGILEGRQIIEIGPGPGGLTRALLACGAFVTVIERDKRCLLPLQDISMAYPGKLRIINDNALAFDYTSFLKNDMEKPKIVSNLPYNIGTQFLLNWLLFSSWPPFYESMTLMFQREVAERIVAKPGSSTYGRLGVLSGWRTHAFITLHVSPKAFVPQPRVTSSIVHIIPKVTPFPCSSSSLEKVTQAAFGQRRKMLRKSLKNLVSATSLAKIGIDGTRRAETLDIKEYAAIANLL